MCIFKISLNVVNLIQTWNMIKIVARACPCLENASSNDSFDWKMHSKNSEKLKKKLVSSLNLNGDICSKKRKYRSNKSTHCSQIINKAVFTHAKKNNCTQPRASCFNRFSRVWNGTFLSPKMTCKSIAALLQLWIRHYQLRKPDRKTYKSTLLL